ncbi:MAG: cupin domain-containing protein [Burkholderiaceae bacterium]
MMAALAQTRRNAPNEPVAPTIGPLAAPVVALRESAVVGMPATQTQEVRVMTATFAPGGRTPLHSHRWPVTVYVLEGHFTLEVEGQAPVVFGPGQAFVEQPGAVHTGHNRDAQRALRVVIFYVSEPGTPFLDPAG